MILRHLLVVDQSTSATKAFVFDDRARVVHRVSIEHRQYYAQPGWVEHDANEIFANTVAAISQVIADSAIPASSIASLSITNQRETAVAWDLTTGHPIYNALVWQDERGQDYCDQLVAAGAGDLVRERTGLLIDSYFSASKLRWLVENIPEARNLADVGRLACGTMDAWLIWKLTAGLTFACDVTNASRTMLFDIHSLEWDRELVALWHLDGVKLPEVRPSDASFGTVCIAGLPAHLPIIGAIGDSHAALVGQGGFLTGAAKVTYGTGSSAMVNIGTACLPAPHGVVTAIAWQDCDAVHYAFEGNVHHTGDTLRWARDEMGLYRTLEEAEALTRSIPDNGGVYLVPAFSGLGAPHWKHGMRALITGLARGSGRTQVIRAAMESIPLQIYDLLVAMANQFKLCELRVDGGPSGNSFLMQLQADILDLPVMVASTDATSARGAAFLAGRATGIWPTIKDLSALSKPAIIYHSAMSVSTRQNLVTGWQAAIRQALATTTEVTNPSTPSQGDCK